MRIPGLLVMKSLAYISDKQTPTSTFYKEQEYSCSNKFALFHVPLFLSVLQHSKKLCYKIRQAEAGFVRTRAANSFTRLPLNLRLTELHDR